MALKTGKSSSVFLHNVSVLKERGMNFNKSLLLAGKKMSLDKRSIQRRMKKAQNVV